MGSSPVFSTVKLPAEQLHRKLRLFSSLHRSANTVVESRRCPTHCLGVSCGRTTWSWRDLHRIIVKRFCFQFSIFNWTCTNSVAFENFVPWLYQNCATTLGCHGAPGTEAVMSWTRRAERQSGISKHGRNLCNNPWRRYDQMVNPKNRVIKIWFKQLAKDPKDMIRWSIWILRPTIPSLLEVTATHVSPWAVAPKGDYKDFPFFCFSRLEVSRYHFGKALSHTHHQFGDLPLGVIV